MLGSYGCGSRRHLADDTVKLTFLYSSRQYILIFDPYLSLTSFGPQRRRKAIMTMFDATLDTRRHSSTLCPKPSGSSRSRFNRMYDVWQQRQALRKLDIDALDDIGISRKQAFAEARRPIWYVPSI